MLPMNFPRWAVWALNLGVCAALWLIGEVFKIAGWQIALGFLAGYLACYFLYGCWRVDDANEDYSRFPPQERAPRRARDRTIDPRVP
jgi:hypothetical protein